MNTTWQCAPKAREKAISPHFIIPLQPFLPPPPAPLAYPHLSLPCLWYVWPTKLQTHAHTHTHHLNMNTAVVWRRECEIVGEIAKMYQRYYHNVQICLPAFVFVVYNCPLVVCMCARVCVWKREKERERGSICTPVCQMDLWFDSPVKVKQVGASQQNSWPCAGFQMHVHVRAHTHTHAHTKAHARRNGQDKEKKEDDREKRRENKGLDNSDRKQTHRNKLGFDTPGPLKLFPQLSGI